MLQSECRDWEGRREAEKGIRPWRRAKDLRYKQHPSQRRREADEKGMSYTDTIQARIR